MIDARRAARRIGAWPIGLALAVLVTAFLRQTDLRVLTGAPVAMRLALPASYVALSPLSRALDALSLLSLAQHVALWLTAIGAWLVWITAQRIARRRARRALVGMLAGALVTYAAVALLPRPMARLVVDDGDLVRVDFHSHTNASHDVPRWFDVAARRAWHEAAGFDVAYVSDHRSWDGVRAALRANPTRGGGSVVLLPAFEGYVGDLHAIFLGLAPADSALVVRQHLSAERLASGRAPVTIATIPGTWQATVDAVARDRPPFVRAVEIVDGAPKGLGQSDRDADALRTRSALLGLVRVAGSNHHGWGRTAVAWNVVRIPRWRALPIDSLQAAIESAVSRGDSSLVQVVARRRPTAATWPLLAATSVVVAWQTLTTLHPLERVSWLAWLGALALVRHARAVRRR